MKDQKNFQSDDIWNSNIQNGTTQHIRRVVQTGLFLALAAVIRNFSYMVYFGGAPGMRISFSGIFSTFPALLFGPLYGGAAAGLFDIIGYLMKPEGAFIPWFTVTAALSGVITGFLWKLLKNIDVHMVQKGLKALFIVIGAVGAVNHISIALMPAFAWTQVLGKIGKNRDFATFGMETVALIGLLLLMIDYLIQKKQPDLQIHKNYLKLLIAVGMAGLIETTLNTYILQLFIPSLGKIGFLVFWIPRLIQEILMTVVQAYIISFLLTIYQKFVLRAAI